MGGQSKVQNYSKFAVEVHVLVFKSYQQKWVSR